MNVSLRLTFISKIFALSNLIKQPSVCLQNRHFALRCQCKKRGDDFTSHSSVDTGCIGKAMTLLESQSLDFLPRAKSTVTGDDLYWLSNDRGRAFSLSFFINGELAGNLHLSSPSAMPSSSVYSSTRLLVLLGFPRTRGICLAVAVPTIKKRRHCLLDLQTASSWRPWESITPPQRCPHTMWSCQRPLL